MSTSPITVDSGDDHDFDDCETSPIARVHVIEPGRRAAYTRLLCDRGGIQIWAQPDEDEETRT